MRRLLLVMAATALLAACSDDDAANSGGAGGANAGYGNGSVGASSLGGNGAGMGAGGSGMLAPGVADRVLFPTARNTLTPQAQDVLSRQAGWMQSNRVSVQIAGNCDERGTEEYNLALGERRANAARDFLVAHGVAAGRISTISYGKDRPASPGSDESAWSQNRNAITSPAGAGQ
jgi:peptidoglycan-associated lipoprotein